MVSLAEESHSKDGNNKDINDEADEEVNSSLDEEIHVRLPDLALVVGVDAPGLDESAVEVQVVGHDDGANDAHRLQQLLLATVRTLGHEHPRDDLDLVRPGLHVLVPKAAHHDRDQQAEESLQLSQSIFVKFKECEILGVPDLGQVETSDGAQPCSQPLPHEAKQGGPHQDPEKPVLHHSP